MQDALSPILVTGGAGFVGAHLVRHLQSRNCDVVVVDDLSNGRRARLPDDVPVYETCISRVDEISRILNKHRCRTVVHLAASNLSRNRCAICWFTIEITCPTVLRFWKPARRQIFGTSCSLLRLLSLATCPEGS